MWWFHVLSEEFFDFYPVIKTYILTDFVNHGAKYFKDLTEKFDLTFKTKETDWPLGGMGAKIVLKADVLNKGAPNKKHYRTAKAIEAKVEAERNYLISLENDSIEVILDKAAKDNLVDKRAPIKLVNFTNKTLLLIIIYYLMHLQKLYLLMIFNLILDLFLFIQFLKSWKQNLPMLLKID